MSVTAALLALTLAAAEPPSAEDRFALVITGAPGGEAFVTSYATWERNLSNALRDRLGFPADHVVALSGANPEAEQSTQQNVRRALAMLKTRMGRDDLLLVVLIGHGSLDEGQAKFNLVGPDLTSVDWAELLRDVPGRLVVVNSTGGSFPFLADLSARGRVVITATQSAAQKYDTVFPEYFIAALTDASTDLDKNGRVSLWELFVSVSRAVAAHYEREGLLTTERAMLEDTGDGAGIELDGRGADGALSRATYLEKDPVATTADPALTELLTRRRQLEEQAEAIKLRKATTPRETWDKEFEQLMIELARVSRRIRSRS